MMRLLGPDSDDVVCTTRPARAGHARCWRRISAASGIAIAGGYFQKEPFSGSHRGGLRVIAKALGV